MKNTPLSRHQEKLKQLAENTDLDSSFLKVELLYRISVLQSLQMFLNSAPAGNENMAEISAHFRALDSFISSLPDDRKYSLKYDEKQIKNQETAGENFSKILEANRRSFRSFKRTDNYMEKIKNFVKQIYVIWYQYRQTYLKIEFSEEQL
jgi:hypothetical protein